MSPHASDEAAFAHVEDLAKALLYEGFVLYPYRASSLKNQQRFPFGVLAPRCYAEAMGDAERWRLHLEVLVHAPDDARLHAQVRCLRYASRDNEAREERIALVGDPIGALRDARRERHTALDAEEDDLDRRFEPLALQSLLEVERLERHVHRVTIEVRNVTQVALSDGARRGRPDRVERQTMVRRSAASVHVLLSVQDSAPTGDGVRERGPSEFVSLLEPPDALTGHVEECRNEGVFPVLVGPAARRDTMLASPVIVYDHPRLAPESPGDFFDGTEMDEMLALRVLTLSPFEQDELRRAGGPGAQLLARVEAMDDDALAALHGRLSVKPPSVVSAGGQAVVVGDRVRIRPRGRGDVMDIALRDRIATIASIEQDVDGVLLVAVTIDDDPGRDLGAQGWPGHRFFYRPDELERLQ